MISTKLSAKINYIFLSVENDPTLNKCEDSWDVLARRNLLEESNILKKCQDTGQVADFTIAEFEETRRMLVCAPRKVGKEKVPFF